MEVLKLFNIKNPILKLKTLANGYLAIIDVQNALRIIDLKTYTVVGGFKSSIKHERISESNVDISLDGLFSISTIPGTNKAALFNAQKKELLYKIGRHQGEIECVGIDPNSRYSITCGQDGKAFAWVIKTARLAFSMPPHSDYVTSVGFSDSGQWIATGSYDRTINLLNIATMKQPMKLRGHNSAVISIIFLLEAKLLSVDKEGMLILWDMRNGKMIKRLTKMNDEPSTMVVSQDKKFAFVGTKLGYVGLYDLQSLEQVTNRYVKESESISSIAFISEEFRIAVGTAEGNVRIYSLFGSDEIYMSMLRDKQYRLFYEAVDANPMLLYSKFYSLVEKIWSDIIEKARQLLEKNEHEKAKELLNQFSGIPKKNAFITQMLRAYEKYAQFQKYVEEGRFPLAYSMAKQYTSFQDSEPYRKMELRWKKLFLKAQELILKPNGDDQARELLAPFRGISDKTALIQQLFEERRMYEYMKKIIAQRDFVKFFELVKIHSFLKEFPEYTSVMEYGNKLYIQAQKGYMGGDYSTARKATEILSMFPDYANEAQELYDTIKAKHLFMDALSSSNLMNAFSYLSSYPLLYDTPEAQVLEKQWNVLVDKALRYAAKGDIAEVLNVFEPYFVIPEKFRVMAGVVAQGYCVQLEQLLRIKAPQEVLESGIRNYVEIFGIDEGILTIFDYFKNRYTTQIDLEMLKQGSYESWSPLIRILEITGGQ